MTIVRKSRVVHKCKVCEREIPIGSTYCGHTVNKTCKWITKNYHISCMLRKVKDINPYCEMLLETLILQMNPEFFVPTKQDLEEIEYEFKRTVKIAEQVIEIISKMHETIFDEKSKPKVLLVCHRGISCNQEYNPADGMCCNICIDENKKKCTYRCVLDVNECEQSFIRIE